MLQQKRLHAKTATTSILFMLAALLEKFHQNRDLESTLFQTDSTYLVIDPLIYVKYVGDNAGGKSREMEIYPDSPRIYER